MVLALAAGMGYAIVTCLTALMVQILCPIGYGEKLTSFNVATMIGLGLVACVLLGMLADKIGRMEEIVKISILIATFAQTMFLIV